jgi:hypothetical protein
VFTARYAPSPYIKQVRLVIKGLKSDKNNGHFKRRPMYIYSYILLIYSQNTKGFRQNQNTHSILNNFFFQNRAVYKIMWKNIAQPDSPQMTIWRMRIACWIPKVTTTHSEYATLIPFPLQQGFHERTSMLRYMSTACLVSIFLTLKAVQWLTKLRNKIHAKFTSNPSQVHSTSSSHSQDHNRRVKMTSRTLYHETVYITLSFSLFWRNSPPPQWARASSFTRFLYHTLRRTTVGRAPLDEW